MDDYRKEKFYIVFLLYYLIFNLQKNKKQKSILTKSKLMNIYHLVNNPILLKKAFKHFGLGGLKSYNPDLYERSLLPSDIQNNEDVTKSLIYLCHINRIKINEDSTIETIGAENDFFYNNSSNFLKDNIFNIKKIVSKSEAQLTKLVME